MAQLPPGVDPAKIPLQPPPKGQTSNFINPPSLASVAEGVGSLLIALETILLVLRSCSNVKTFGRLRFEDCMSHSEDKLQVAFLTVSRLGYLRDSSDLWILCSSHAL